MEHKWKRMKQKLRNATPTMEPGNSDGEIKGLVKRASPFNPSTPQIQNMTKGTNGMLPVEGVHPAPTGSRRALSIFLEVLLG